MFFYTYSSGPSPAVCVQYVQRGVCRRGEDGRSVHVVSSTYDCLTLQTLCVLPARV